MTDKEKPREGLMTSAAISSRFGFYSAVSTVVLAILTFGLAMTAIPISGANCPGNCVQYPYLNTASQYPRDFLWMAPAVILVLAYVALMTSIHACAPAPLAIFSQVGLSFALIAAGVLVSDYYVQFSVIPMSLMSHETEGLAALIQYNPHGVFLSLEEAGYLVMSLSFVFMAPVFAGRNRLEAAVRWVFVIAFVLVIGSLAVIGVNYGLGRLDRLEVAILSIDWLTLIVAGILLSLLFRRQMRNNPSPGR